MKFKSKVLSRGSLMQKTRNDLKADIIMSVLSGIGLAFFYARWLIGKVKFNVILISGLFFLLWFNSYLITKRNLNTLEVM